MGRCGTAPPCGGIGNVENDIPPFVGTEVVSLLPRERPMAAGRCEHGSLVLLGSGVGALYRRCEDCGHVIVTAGGRAWTIPQAGGPRPAVSTI